MKLCTPGAYVSQHLLHVLPTESRQQQPNVGVCLCARLQHDVSTHSSWYSAGAVINPTVVQMMRKMLETNFRLQIYREYGDWIHALFDANVQPTLVAQYKSVKGTMGFSHRYSRCCPIT